MKAILISNLDLEGGRGPVFRLLHMLPFLNKKIDLHMIVLGEAGSAVKAMLESEQIRYSCVDYVTEGWFVCHLQKLTDDIADIARRERPDILVLEWELWDLLVALLKRRDDLKCELAVLYHSMPFLDALPFPGTFADDFAARYAGEKNPMIREYLESRREEADAFLTAARIISINETVSFYLDNYFGKGCYYEAIPGYALDTEDIFAVSSSCRKKYDFCFMAKLETSKGIFELLDIMRRIVERKRDARMLVIGSFQYPEEAARAKTLIGEYGIADNVVFGGWKDGEDKYRALSECRIFLYPSLSGDTFSFCLLEALACGLPAVSYNTPFIRNIYHDAPVTAVGYKENERFAEAALQNLEGYSKEAVRAAQSFVEEHYSSWERVADAEVRAYRAILADAGDGNFS